MRGLLRCAGLSAVVGALLLVPAPARAADRPPNDDFAAATPLSATRGIAYGTLAGATVEPECAEPRKAYGGWVGDRSVWFKWTPPTHGWLRFDLHTFGGWTGYVDALRGRSNCLSHGSAAYVDSDSGGYGQLEVTRGEPVWLGVYSYGAANVGTFGVAFRVIPRSPPLNDHLADADVLPGRYGALWRTTRNATRQSGEPTHAGRTGGRSAWFRWTAPLSGPAMFHAGAGPRWDCLVAVYTGTSLGALAPVGSDASTWAGNSCTARFTATAGVTYVVAVDGERGEDADFLLTWNSGPRPAHDAPAGALVVSGFKGMLDDTNRGATDEPGDPRDTETRSGSSVWYRWTAPDDGVVMFDVHSPPLYEPTSYWEHDKRVAVFTGSPGALTLLGASPAPPVVSINVHVPVTRGTTYWVQVTGTHAQVVHYQLTWRLTPETNDEFAEPLTLPPTGSVTVDTNGATAEPGEPGHGLHGHAARRSLWFAWTAPTTGTVTFDDFAGEDAFYDQPALSAYTGDRLDALARVPVEHVFMGGWRRWSFAAKAGTTYRIALDEDSYWGHGRWHRLSWYYGTRSFTAPAVTLTAPADGAVVGGPVTVSPTASDDVGVWSVGYSHDASATEHHGPHPEAAPYDFVLDTERYNDGPLTTRATAWDTHGNPGRSADHRLVVENRPPAARWLGSPDQLTTDTSALLRWHGGEPLRAARCSLDGAPYVDCGQYVGVAEGERSFAGLAEGRHVFRILFTDLHGNTSPDPDGYWWIVDTKGVGVVPPSDTTAPTVTAPYPDLLPGHPVGTTTAPVRLSWTSRDAETGIQRHDLHLSVNGGAWRAAPTFGSLTRTVQQLAAGRTYRFRVRAWDWAGRASGWRYGPTFGVGMAQESTGWSYSAGWRRVALSNASGGYVARTATKGAYARYAFTGRSIAVFGPRLSSLGKSAVYLDGVRVATLNQWDSHGEARATLFVRNGLDPTRRHVLEIRSLGVPGYPGGGTAVAVDVAARVVH